MEVRPHHLSEGGRRGAEESGASPSPGNFACHPLAPGVWLVVIARWKAAGATFDELRTDFQKVAKRAGVLVRENPPSQSQTRPAAREAE